MEKSLNNNNVPRLTTVDWNKKTTKFISSTCFLLCITDINSIRGIKYVMQIYLTDVCVYGRFISKRIKTLVVILLKDICYQHRHIYCVPKTLPAVCSSKHLCSWWDLFIHWTKSYSNCQELLFFFCFTTG